MLDRAFSYFYVVFTACRRVGNDPSSRRYMIYDKGSIKNCIYRMRNLYYVVGLVLAMSLMMISCGEDEPAGLTPVDPDLTPVDPTPPPTVDYDGFAFIIALDSVAGDVDGFYAWLDEAVKERCPELQKQSDGSYKAVLVYDKVGDRAALTQLMEKTHQFAGDLSKLLKGGSLVSPVVTSKISYEAISESNVQKDWSVSASAQTGSNAFAVLIPRLKETTWTVEDANGTGVDSFSFGEWGAVLSRKATFKSSVKLNGSDEYTAIRQGNIILVEDKEGYMKYSFAIDSGGETIYLYSIDGKSLEEDAMPVYRQVKG